MEVNFLHLKRGIYGKPVANHIINGKDYMLPTKTGNKAVMLVLTISIQHGTAGSSQRDKGMERY